MREHWRNAAAKNWRRDARVVLGLELRRLAQPRPISLEINRLGLLSQAKGRAVYAATPCAASPVAARFETQDCRVSFFFKISGLTQISRKPGRRLAGCRLATPLYMCEPTPSGS